MATLRVLQVNLCRLLSRLGKSFKSTTVYLPGQSGRSYISRSSEAATQNQRVKALPGVAAPVFPMSKTDLGRSWLP